MSEPVPVSSQMADPVYKKEQVIHIINSVLSKVDQAEAVPSASILNELQQLQKMIEDMRTDMGAGAPQDIQNKHIPTATDELDAVVEATAEASGAIMDACDIIQEKTAGLDGQAAQEISDQVIKIFEACSFQDITGQRITKVVSTLKLIEEKVTTMLHVFGTSEGAPTATERPDNGDKGLLNGPQLPGKGVSQDDIDTILAEFDD